MNNNLGRFRLSVTDEAVPDADPLPPLRSRRARDSAGKRTPAQADDAVLATGGRRVPECKEREREDRGAVEASGRPVRRSLVAAEARRAARHVPPEARRLPQAGRAGRRPACPRSCTRCRPNADAQPADAGEVAGGQAIADDGARVRQSRLAGVLRHRPRRHAGGFRHCRATSRSHPELLDWLAVRVHGHGLVDQETAPPDRHSARPIASRRRSRRNCSRRTRTTGCSPAGRASASTARSSATSRSRRADCSTRRSAGRASSRRRPRSSSSRRRATGRSTGSRRRAKIAIAARSTRSAAARRRTRRSPCSTCPIGDASCVKRIALEHAAAGAHGAERDRSSSSAPARSASARSSKAARPTRSA